ncbi:MAG: SecY-interacting protein [Alkalimonas sp.]|nr:SecY-interacting protein [Alkalimonas sp.]
MDFATAWHDFIERSLEWYRQQQQPLLTERDKQLPSPCELPPATDDQVEWQPVLQASRLDFSAVEQALELSLHQDIKLFYGLYYGGGLAASHPDGKLLLLMPWHEADCDRLKENIIGHILMKRRLKQRETVFIAVTDDEQTVISVLNETGEVFAERVGKEVERKLADNLAEFLQQLQPASTEGI